MKRAAESQLTKDTVDDEDDTKEPPIGIQMADPSALSNRKMHNLPKRPLVPATPPATSTSPAIGSSNGTTTKSPESASRFSGFTGFGNSASSAFTFTVPASQAKANVTEAHQATTPSSSQPAKGFSFSPLSNPTPPSTPPSTSDPQAKRDAVNKYSLSLRGLNASFLDAIRQAIQADPFVDVTEMLEKYKALRSSAQKEYDNSLSSPPTSGAAVLLSKNPPFMPTPPKSFFAFGKGTGTDTTSQSRATGFTPKLDHSRKEPPSHTKDGISDNPPSLNTSQPFAVGNMSSSSGNQISGLLPAPFGSSALESPSRHDTGSTGFKMTTPDKLDQGQDTLQGKITASSFNFKSSAPTVPITPGLSSFLTPSKLSDTGDSKSNASNPSPSSSNPVGFGTGVSSSVSGPFPFGKGSIGNPVGFAFGSPSPTAPHSDVKLFDTTETSSDPELKIPSDPDAALSKTSQDPSPAPSQGSVYDADGPGEEDEVTLHEVKAQAYKMTSTGEKKTWVPAGRGQLKLKGRVDGKRRILMRKSSNGQVILNFNLFPGFNMNVNGRMISFRVPGEDESAAVYQLRLPNSADADNCQKAIQKEVDASP